MQTLIDLSKSISNRDIEWDVRLDALTSLTELVKDEAVHSHPDFISTLTKYVARGLKEQLNEERSQVMRSVGTFVQTLAQVCGTRFRPLTPLMKLLFKRVAQTKAVIASACQRSMEAIAKHCAEASVVGKFAEGAAGKHPVTRLRCVECLVTIVKAKDSASWLTEDQGLSAVEGALRHVLADGDAKVRQAARALWVAYKAQWSERAPTQVWNHLSSSTQQQVQRGTSRKSTSSSSALTASARKKRLHDLAQRRRALQAARAKAESEPDVVVVAAKPEAKPVAAAPKDEESVVVVAAKAEAEPIAAQPVEAAVTPVKKAVVESIETAQLPITPLAQHTYRFATETIPPLRSPAQQAVFTVQSPTVGHTATTTTTAAAAAVVPEADANEEQTTDKAEAEVDDMSSFDSPAVARCVSFSPPNSPKRNSLLLTTEDVEEADVGTMTDGARVAMFAELRAAANQMEQRVAVKQTHAKVLQDVVQTVELKSKLRKSRSHTKRQLFADLEQAVQQKAVMRDVRQKVVQSVAAVAADAQDQRAQQRQHLAYLRANVLAEVPAEAQAHGEVVAAQRTASDVVRSHVLPELEQAVQQKAEMREVRAQVVQSVAVMAADALDQRAQQRQHLAYLRANVLSEVPTAAQAIADASTEAAEDAFDAEDIDEQPIEECEGATSSDLVTEGTEEEEQQQDEEEEDEHEEEVEEVGDDAADVEEEEEASQDEDEEQVEEDTQSVEEEAEVVEPAKESTAEATSATTKPALNPGTPIALRVRRRRRRTCRSDAQDEVAAVSLAQPVVEQQSAAVEPESDAAETVEAEVEVAPVEEEVEVAPVEEEVEEAADQSAEGVEEAADQSAEGVEDAASEDVAEDESEDVEEDASEGVEEDASEENDESTDVEVETNDEDAVEVAKPIATKPGRRRAAAPAPGTPIALRVRRRRRDVTPVEVEPGVEEEEEEPEEEAPVSLADEPKPVRSKRRRSSRRGGRAAAQVEQQSEDVDPNATHQASPAKATQAAKAPVANGTPIAVRIRRRRRGGSAKGR